MVTKIPLMKGSLSLKNETKISGVFLVYIFLNS